MNDLAKIAEKLLLSESTKRLNSHLSGPGAISGESPRSGPEASIISEGPRPGKRIRQSSASLNKLEQEWFNILNVQFPMYPRPRAQAVRFRLCNGVTYTPDVFIPCWPSGEEGGPAMPTAFEVKGKHAWDDAIVKLKMAASEWPEIKFVLVWKEGGQWHSQRVLP